MVSSGELVTAQEAHYQGVITDAQRQIAISERRSRDVLADVQRLRRVVDDQDIGRITAGWRVLLAYQQDRERLREEARAALRMLQIQRR